jgi:hypothetical protein
MGNGVIQPMKFSYLLIFRRICCPGIYNDVYANGGAR